MEYITSSTPLRLLGIDYGEARIGVAGSDGLGLLAHPLETVPAQPRAEALKRIVGLYHQRNAEAVVMGLPVRADGEEGTAAAKVKQFAEALRALLPQETMIYFQDEYRSTVQATEHLRASGKRTKNHRTVIDQAAAVVILQDFLDARPTPLPDHSGTGMD
jgi:putative holliday junction resolvase